MFLPRLAAFERVLRDMMRGFLLLLLTALACAASGVDGRWSASIEPRPAKTGKTNNRVVTFEIASAGNALTGTMHAGGRRAPAVALQNGKLEGDRVSFTTTRAFKDGTQRTFQWSGTVAGDELKLTRVAEGKKRGIDISARRQ